MARWAGTLLSVLTLLSAACTARDAQPDFPKSVSGGWHLERIARGLPPKPGWTAIYGGAGSARARVWAVKSVEEGLDRTQTWRAQQDTVVFSSDRYFAAVDWSGADRAQAGALVRAIEHCMGVKIGVTQQADNNRHAR